MKQHKCHQGEIFSDSWIMETMFGYQSNGCHCQLSKISGPVAFIYTKCHTMTENLFFKEKCLRVQQFSKQCIVLPPAGQLTAQSDAKCTFNRSTQQ